MNNSATTRSRQLEAARRLLTNGRHAEARAKSEQILAMAPDCAEAWHILGLSLYAAGDPGAALQALEKAESLDAGLVQATLDRAALLRELGQTNRALEVLERKLAARPGEDRLVVARAETLCRLNRGAEALPDLEPVIRRQPRDPALRVRLAECLEQGAQPAAALEALDRALELTSSRSAPIHRQRARILLREGKIDAAERALARAQAAARADAPEERARVHLALADLAALQGDFTRAAEQARSALGLDPGLYTAWLHVVPGRRKPPARDLFQTLAGLCRDKAGDPYAWPVFVASGRALEAAGQYDAAFRLYTSANLKRSYLTPYDPEARRRLTANIVEKLDRSFVSRVPGNLPGRTTRPIFIIGLPRSGTTLLESILATHPDVAAGGEMSVLYDWLSRRFGNYSMLETGTLLSELPDAEIRALAEHWGEAVDRAGNGAPWLTDKLPDNFVFAGLCHMCFPDAPIIWMQRDPRDIAISCYTTPFMNGQEHGNRLEWLGQYHRLYARLMSHWREVLPADRIIPVEYEELVRHPEETTQRLFAGIGLSWDPACLDFHRQDRPIATASLQQVREPLNDSSIGRWRAFAGHLQPLIATLEDTRDPLQPDSR